MSLKNACEYSPKTKFKFSSLRQELHISELLTTQNYWLTQKLSPNLCRKDRITSRGPRIRLNKTEQEIWKRTESERCTGGGGGGLLRNGMVLCKARQCNATNATQTKCGLLDATESVKLLNRTDKRKEETSHRKLIHAAFDMHRKLPHKKEGNARKKKRKEKTQRKRNCRMLPTWRNGTCHLKNRTDRKTQKEMVCYAMEQCTETQRNGTVKCNLWHETKTWRGGGDKREEEAEVEEQEGEVR